MSVIINPRQIIKDGITSLRDVWSSSKVSTELSGKQATLVSGTNIKTINNTSLLGSGDITIQGGGGEIPKINMTATTATLDPNKFYVWGEVASLDISLAPETAGIENIYKFQFQSGAIATTLTLPSNIKWYDDKPSDKSTIYIISIQSDIAKIERSWHRSRIPATYQEVEYLKGDGNAYLTISQILIDTGDITNIVVTFDNLKVGDDVCGYYLNNLGYGFVIGERSDNSHLRWWIGSSIKTHIYDDPNYKTTIEFKNNTFYQNGIVMDTNYTPASYTITQFGLFGHRGYASIISDCAIYEFSLTSASYSINCVPCYRKSDNVAGMYDLVSGIFYHNLGSGSFIVGPDV